MGLGPSRRDPSCRHVLRDVRSGHDDDGAGEAARHGAAMIPHLLREVGRDLQRCIPEEEEVVGGRHDEAAAGDLHGGEAPGGPQGVEVAGVRVHDDPSVEEDRDASHGDRQGPSRQNGPIHERLLRQTSSHGFP